MEITSLFLLSASRYRSRELGENGNDRGARSGCDPSVSGSNRLGCFRNTLLVSKNLNYD